METWRDAAGVTTCRGLLSERGGGDMSNRLTAGTVGVAKLIIPLLG